MCSSVKTPRLSVYAATTLLPPALANHASATLLTMVRYAQTLSGQEPPTVAIQHPVPDRVKQSFVIFDIRAL